ncbi:tyrosine-type recombinase/integrase [Halapricum desulfuricans]|uniref:XerD/XerC family integrase n=1 Tax=Halapricum desulfuricans TaxID=2841257 RepID=A0A897MXZ4_9EURY|nr:tyrosine-type recombinase/integrase [Halapricum desulfuricans]QSG05327.1 XerD/XerC family integrase [Halapricum desulfuricans]
MRPQDEAPNLPIEEAIEVFVTHNRPNWKGETERTYRRNLGRFAEYAAENDLQTLGDLTRWDVGGFSSWLLEKDYAKATVASRQKAVKTWLKFCESQGLIDHGMHTAIETLKLDDEEETSDQQLDPEDARTLLSFYRESPKWRGTRRHAVLEVLWHTGCRMSGLLALDLDDYDPERGDLHFRNRPETDTRLKRGNTHQRNVTLSSEPQDVLELYLARERLDQRDEHGREPLFASQNGRPTKGTLRYWTYEATQPCMAVECPHGKRRPNCEWVPRNRSSLCPSTRAPHAIRRGSITWQLNLGFDLQTVADRAAATPSVIRRYYDDPNYDDELDRRRSETEEIDIQKHLSPDDLGDSE